VNTPRCSTVRIADGEIDAPIERVHLTELDLTCARQHSRTIEQVDCPELVVVSKHTPRRTRGGAVGAGLELGERWPAACDRRTHRSNTDAVTSATRIRTTHVGSLPRSPEVLELLYRRDAGDDPPQFDDVVRSAVVDAVAKQVAVDIDVVGDGELGKVSYATYVARRMTGFTIDDSGDRTVATSPTSRHIQTSPNGGAARPDAASTRRPFPYAPDRSTTQARTS
jgi:hypothetical protein